MRFRDLHRPGDPFVLMNAWDVGSARVVTALGAEAIGTSSAAHAFTLGRADMGSVSRDEALAHAEVMVEATSLPVSADFENGFAREPDGVAETVRLGASTGVAGLSIEDTDLPGAGSYEVDLAVERIAAAAAAACSVDGDLVLLARADGVLNGSYDVDEGIRRLQAYAAAGADAVYLPGPPDVDALRRICESVSVPVNALAAGPFTSLTRDEFAALGVARISLGSSLARVTHRVLIDAARTILGDGDFSSLSGGTAGSEVDALLAAGSRVDS